MNVAMVQVIISLAACYRLEVEIDQRRFSSRSIPLYSLNNIGFCWDINDLTYYVFYFDRENVFVYICRYTV